MQFKFGQLEFLTIFLLSVAAASAVTSVVDVVVAVAVADWGLTFEN